eukprot:6226253-Pyramimonas_sp.AAC.1
MVGQSEHDKPMRPKVAVIRTSALLPGPKVSPHRPPHASASIGGRRGPEDSDLHEGVGANA